MRSILKRSLKLCLKLIHHSILLNKLSTYGIHTPLIANYLSNRKQFTLINETKSEFEYINCGVPQGSILGPLFFLLYINDLEQFAPMKCLLFADDTTLLIHGKDSNELIQKANEGIQVVNAWFQFNKLTVHPEKTNFMAFNLRDRPSLNNKIKWGNTLLKRIGKGESEVAVKYVGILIDEDLNFKQHGKHVINKVKQNSYLISNVLPLTKKLLILRFDCTESQKCGVYSKIFYVFCTTVHVI